MKGSWRQLGEVADFVNGLAFKPEDWETTGRKIIRIQNLTDPDKPFNHTSRQVADKYLVYLDDILFSWSATLGVFVWNKIEPAVLNQHIFKVIPNDSLIDKWYLRYVLENAIQRMSEHLHGATMQHINRGEFLGTLVYVPSLAEQKRIAATLDEADALRRKRRESIAKLDAFLQSVFLEMFGDPATNPKAWGKCTLGDVIHSTKDGPHVSPNYVEHGIPFLSTRHVRAGQIVWEDMKYISQEDAAIHWKKCKPARGDILYTKGGTTGIAKVVDFDADVAIWVHIALLKTNHALVVPVWLEYMLNSTFCYEQSQRFTHGIANRDLGLKRMVNIQMYLPPYRLQQRFANFFEEAKKRRQQQQCSLHQLDNLFRGVQNEAFSTQPTVTSAERTSIQPCLTLGF